MRERAVNLLKAPGGVTEELHHPIAEHQPSASLEIRLQKLSQSVLDSFELSERRAGLRATEACFAVLADIRPDFMPQSEASLSVCS